jgi:hypothetical protein
VSLASDRGMTVAHIREPKGADDVDVVFLESARFYKLPRAHPRFNRILSQLRYAMARGRLVQVRLTSPHGDIIEDVELA